MRKIKDKMFYCVIGGVIWSFLLVILWTISTTSYAAGNEPIKTSIVKYPIYINGDPVDLEAYNINGKTYLSVSDIAKETHLNIYWDEEKRKVDIVDASFLSMKDIENQKYIDMSYWFYRYNSNQEIGGKMATEVLPFTLEHDSILSNDTSKNEHNVIVGIPMDNKYAYNWYVDYSYYLEYIHPLMPNIIIENEKILENVDKTKSPR